jgi:hypothetical protein
MQQACGTSIWMQHREGENEKTLAPSQFYFPTSLIAMHKKLHKLLYVSLERSTVELAKSFIDLHVQVPNLDSDSWVSAYEKRKKAEEWLKLTTPWINVKSGLAVFTPLIGGLISYIIPK